MPLQLPLTDPCALCEELAGRRPYTVLSRGERVSILVTREQRGVGHVLVMPNAHRPTLLDLTSDELEPLMQGVQLVARLIAQAYDPPGITVWQNNGVPAGQSIAHVHVHVAGTYADGTAWGSVPRLAIADTDAIACVLRSHLTSAADDGNPSQGLAPKHR